MRRKTRKKMSLGFTLVEIVIAIALLATTTTAIGGMIINGQNSAQQTIDESKMNEESATVQESLHNNIIATNSALKYWVEKNDSYEMIEKDTTATNNMAVGTKILGLYNVDYSTYSLKKTYYKYDAESDVLYLGEIAALTTEDDALDSMQTGVYQHTIDGNIEYTLTRINWSVLAENVTTFSLDFTECESSRIAKIQATIGDTSYNAVDTIYMRNEIVVNENPYIDPKAENSVLIPSLDDTDFIYNGSEYTVHESNFNINYVTRLDGSVLTAKNAGTYSVSYALKNDTLQWSDGTKETKVVTWKISPASLNLKWGTTSWVYDGSSHSTTATIVGTVLSGDVVSISLSGNSVGPAVGTSTVTASLAGTSKGNYALSGKTPTSTTISITKAPDVEYRLVFNTNGGQFPSSVTSYLSQLNNNVFSISIANPSRPCYTFVGWATTSNATAADVGSSYTISSGKSATLYAVWQAKTFSLTYNLNGGSGSNTTVSQSANDVFTIPDYTPTREDYTFKGWSSTSTGSVEYEIGDLVELKDTTSKTIYAVWVQDNVYTLSYNNEGGVDGPEDQVQKKSNVFTISTIRPTRAGFSFVGWSLYEDGNADYKPGGQITLSSTDLTLHAVWTASTLRLNFNANGGTGAPTTRTQSGNPNFTIPDKTPTYVGYKFAGWKTMSGSTIYNAGDVISISTETTLYAQWETVDYTLKYSGTNVTGLPSNQTQTANPTFKISSTIPTETSQLSTFIGWALTEDGEPEYEAGDTITITGETLTLYAVFEANEYTLTYDLNGGTYAETNLDINRKITGTNQTTIESITPTRDGHTFLGWSDTESGSVKYKSGDSITIGDNGTTIYAVWNPITYTLTFNGNGGTNVPSKITQSGNFVFEIPDDVPTRDNYTFVGWADNDSGEIVTYTFSATKQDSTLVAQWKEKENTLIYNGNNGGFSDGYSNHTVTKKGTSSFTIDETPTRKGYEFLGWSDEKLGSVQYSYGDTLTVSGEKTIYAIWKVIEYTLSYDANGGAGGPSDQTQYGDNVFAINSVKPSRSGYQFIGWATTSTATVSNVGTSMTISGKSQTIYAVWQALTYTLNYNANGGSGAPATQTQSANAQFTISSVVPTRQYCTFLGWSTNQSATKADYQSGSSITISGTSTLYAIWKSNSYILQYDANGGTCSVTEEVGSTDQFTITSTIPTKSNKVFLGWATTKTATTAQYSAGDSITIAQSPTILYAVWTNKEYTLTYDANGGTGAPAAVTQSGDNIFSISGDIPTRTAYTFVGWATSASAKTADVGTTITVTKDTTIYAVWGSVSVTLSYDSNGGSGSPASVTNKGSYTFTISTTVPTRKNYTFAGWSTSSGASSAEYASGATATFTENTTLYAVWISDGFTLTYDANGGENAPSQVVQMGNNVFVVSSVIPTREGYSFLGWGTSSAGSASYSSGNSYTMSGQTATLYAIWSANTYTLTYDSNGGTGTIPQQTQTGNTTFAISQTGPTWALHTFLGWSTSATGGVNVGTSYTVSSAKTTLYAVWQENSYTLTYDANGGSDVPSAVTQYANNVFTITKETPTKDGYAFAGWSSTASGSTEYSAGNSITLTGNKTLYAVWSQTVYTLNYNANGGTNAPSSQTSTSNTFTITSSVPTRTGYVFQGWATSASGSAEYQSGGTFEASNSTATLYAIWKENAFVLTFDANEGSGAPSAITQNTLNFTIPSTVPTRSGYTFLGWGDTQSGSAKYTAGGTYTMSSSVSSATIYAIWGTSSYTVTFDANGGSGAPSAITVNSAVGTCNIPDTEPTKDYNDFLGWSENSASSVADYVADDTLTVTGNVTLYAVWQKRTYTLYYDFNEGTNGPSTQTATGTQSFRISSITPTREYYTFAGWESEDGTTYSAGDYITISGSSETLTAVWANVTYTLTYDYNNGTGTTATDTNVSPVFDTTLYTATRDGYTFKGWATTALSSTVDVSDSFTITGTAQTVYAVWSANSYTLTYNANGGTGAPAAQTQSGSLTFTISHTVPTRTNYTFVGWGLTSTTAAEYAMVGGDTYEVENSSTTLYAIWDLSVYSLSFDANGGSGAPSTMQATKDSDGKATYTIPNTTPTRTCYSFLGWATSSSATSAEYLIGGTYTTTKSSSTLYAVWQEAHSFISQVQSSTYLKSAATCTSAAVYYYKCANCDAKGTLTYTYGSALGHNPGSWQTDGTKHWKVCSRCSTILSEESHTFGGWTVTTAATCTTTGTQERTCSVCGKKETQTISVLGHNYASSWSSDGTNHWHACTRCTATSDTAAHTYGDWTITKAATCTTTGTKQRTCTVCGYAQTETIAASGHSYTAQVQSSTYLKSAATCTSAAVYYYKCANCDAKGTETYTYGSALGHNLGSYQSDSTNHWKVCSRCSALVDTTAHTYGSWTTTKEATCTTTGSRNRTCSVCGYVQTETIAKIDHTFTLQNPTSANLRSAATTSAAATYYYQCAYCSQNSHGFTETYFSYGASLTVYTLSYDANGGTGAPSTQSQIDNKVFTISTTVPTRSGYTFLGWNTSSTATTALTGTQITVTATNTTLYAVWVSSSTTAKAILCDNGELTFLCDDTTYAVGDTFTTSSGSSTISVISELESEGLTSWAGTSWYNTDDSPFASMNTATKVVIQPSMASVPVNPTYWFSEFESLTGINGLENLNTSTATTFDFMFFDCISLTELDLSSFDTSNATTFYGMFDYCESLTELDLSSFDTSNATNFGCMFGDCSSLTKLNVSNFDTNNAESFSSMFSGCISLTELDVSSFDTSKATNFTNMFCNCESLTELDVSSFNTSNATSFSSMFSYCKSLIELDLSSFETSNVTSFTNMFSHCSSLTELDVSSFDTSNATDFYGMFSDCTSLTELDLSSFDTSKATKFGYMFYKDTNLAHICVGSEWATTSATSSSYMFYNCTSLPNFSSSYIDVTRAYVGTDGYLNYHNFAVVEATCTTAGGYGACTYCGHLPTDTVIPVLGHNYSSTWTSDGTNHWHKCTRCSATSDTAAHTYGAWTTTTAATCTTTGSRNRTCSVCGYVQTETIAKIDHTFTLQNPTSANLRSAATTSAAATYYYQCAYCSQNSHGFTETYFSYGASLTVYTLSYDANGGTGAPSTQSQIDNKVFTISTTVPTRSGYTFVGWNTSSTATTALTGTQITVTATNTTLYAVWVSSTTTAKAILCDNGELTFLCDNTTYAVGDTFTTSSGSSTISAISELESSGLSSWSGTSWYNTSASPFEPMETATKVVIQSSMASVPVNPTYWFYDFMDLEEINGLANLNTSTATNFSHMFEFCTEITELDLSNFDTSNASDFSNMFDNCTSLTELDLSSFDTSNATNFSWMFYYCKRLAELDLSSFDTSNTTDFSAMFSDCSSLTKLDLSSFDTSNATSFYSMFYYCKSLTELDVSNFDTSNATNFSWMFYYCDSLTELDLSSFDTGNATDLSSMFYYCDSLTELDLSSFDTSNATDFSAMFSGCSSLTKLDLSSFDTSNATDFYLMFGYDSNLAHICVGTEWSTTSVTSSTNMFLNCTSLPNYNKSYKDKTRAYVGTDGYLNYHNFAVVEATCTTAGGYGACTYCGHLSTDTTIPALGHNYSSTYSSDATNHWNVCTRCSAVGNTAVHTYGSWTTTTEATCTTTGTKQRTCTVCGYVQTSTIAALGHNYSSTWTSDGTNHWHKCTRCSATSDTAVHTYGSWTITTAATCTTTGSQKRTCSVCSYVQTQTIAASGHSYTAQVQSSTYLKSAATCTSAAVYYYKCANCTEKGTETYTYGSALGHNLGSYQADDVNHWKVCSRCSALVDTTAHTYGSWTTTTAATCTTAGSQTRTCSVCNHVQTQTIAALGHNPGEWTTTSTSHWRYCSRCSEKINDGTHTFSDWVTTTAATCTTAGEKERTCTVCSYKETETIAALNHSYGDWVTTVEANCTNTGVKQKTCSRCGDVVTEEIAIDPNNHTYASIPDNYKLLDYIQASSNDYIATGVTGTDTDAYTLDLDIQFIDNGTRQLMGFGGNGGEYFGIVQSTGYYGLATWLSSSISYGNRDNVVWKYSYSTIADFANGLYVNGTYGHSAKGTAIDGKELQLLGMGGSYLNNAKLYHARIWKNDEVVRDYFPVYDYTTGTYGLYDAITGTFNNGATGGLFTGSDTSSYVTTNPTCTTAGSQNSQCVRCGAANPTATSIAALGHDFSVQTVSDTYFRAAATDQLAMSYYYACSRCAASSGGNTNTYFTVGDSLATYKLTFNANNGSMTLPSGYTRLEKITLAAGTYIDTGYVPTEDTQIDIQYKCSSTENDEVYVFGAGGSSYSDNSYEMYPWDGELNFNIGTRITFDKPMTTNRERLVWANGTYEFTTQTGQSLGSGSTDNASRPTLSLYIGGLHRTTGTYTGTKPLDIFYCILKDSTGTVIHSYYPAQNSSGSVGLYDTTTGTFLTASAGTVTAGDTISSNSPTYTQINNNNFNTPGYAPVRSGYKFLGWADSASATTPDYEQNGTISLDSPASSPNYRESTKTVYAVWVQVYTTTLNYDANGGSGAPASQSMETTTSGSGDFTISSTAPTVSGGNFLGWATTSTATSPEYQPGEQITWTGATSKTLYAVWQQYVWSKYSVSRSIGSLSWSLVAENQYTFLTIGKFVRIVNYSQIPSLLTLTAGTETTGSSTFDASFSNDWSSISATKVGWGSDSLSNYLGTVADFESTATSGSPGVYLVEGNNDGVKSATWSANLSTSTDYYALMISNTGNGGSYSNIYTPSVNLAYSKGPTSYGTVTSISSTTYPTNGVQSQGLTGEGYWYVRETSNILVYNANGGSNAPDMVKSSGTSFTISSTCPTRSGYTFIGWSTSSSASSASYFPGDVITVENTKTLYAVWTLIRGTEIINQVPINYDTVKTYWKTDSGTVSYQEEHWGYNVPIIDEGKGDITSYVSLTDAGKNLLYSGVPDGTKPVQFYAYTGMSRAAAITKGTITCQWLVQGTVVSEKSTTDASTVKYISYFTSDSNFVTEQTRSTFNCQLSMNGCEYCYVYVGGAQGCADDTTEVGIWLMFKKVPCKAVALPGVSSATVSTSEQYVKSSVTYSCTVASGYTFQGWYSDAACTNLVSTSQTYTRNAIDGSNVLFAKANKGSATTGKALNHNASTTSPVTAGSDTTYEDTSVTDYIEVPSGCTNVTVYAGNKTHTFDIFFEYDSSKNYLSYWGYNAAERTMTFDYPDSIKYIRMTYITDQKADCYIKDNTHGTYLWQGSSD